MQTNDPSHVLPPVPPFLAAAAVLTSFDPAVLRPAGEVADPDLELGDLLLECEPTAAAVGGPSRWQLEESVRRQTLRRLGRQPDGLRRALDANAAQRPDDPVQRAMEELIRGSGDMPAALTPGERGELVRAILGSFDTRGLDFFLRLEFGDESAAYRVGADPLPYHVAHLPDPLPYRVARLVENLHKEGRLGALLRALADHPGPAGGLPGPSPELRALAAKLLAALWPRQLDGRPLEELLALVRASDWLAGAVGQRLPPRDELLARIDRERLLKPLRRLLARGFVGRNEELRRLHDFLLERRPGRILSLHGPGGVGKSTLLARFIMEVVAPESVGSALARQPFLFAYLDVDRTVVDPRDPASFAKEAARQLEAQGRGARDLAEAVQRGLVGVATRYETAQLESVVDDVSQAGALLTRLTKGLAREVGRPVLLVVDTWEEVQAAGASGEAGILRLLAELAASPSVRVVCAGRAPLRTSGLYAAAPTLVDIPVESFDEPTAEDYLVRVARVPPRAVTPIIRAVGTNPLSLALAARVVEREGPEAAADLPALVAKVKSEQIQGQLYTRLLGHIRDRDPKLQVLAYPGLVVRRITPDVIRHVLAGPCAVPVPDDDTAEALFHRLEAQTGLVEPDEDDTRIVVGGQPTWPLRHLAGLRRLALADLRRTMPEQVAAIHAAAIGWYGRQEGSRARAEEIYHRLASGEVPPAGLWQPSVERWLRAGSLPELPARGRIWLLERLNRSLDPETRAAADLESWERDTAEQARAFLARREWRPALALLRERHERSSASPLWMLEAQALVQGGLLAEAEALLRKGVASGAEQGEPGWSFELLLLLAEVQARRGDHQAALAVLDEAEPFGFAAGEISRLRRLIAALRAQRKLGRAEDQKARQEGLARLDRSATANELERRPALLRETVAELGRDRPMLLARAVVILGIGWVPLPHGLAPLGLGRWLAEPLGKVAASGAARRLVWSFTGSNAGDILLRSAVDLLRSTIAAGVRPGAVGVGLVEYGEMLASRLRSDPKPSTVAWCVDLYRAEVEAIAFGQGEPDGPRGSPR